jgi:hypothetical protein
MRENTIESLTHELIHPISATSSFPHALKAQLLWNYAPCCNTGNWFQPDLQIKIERNSIETETETKKKSKLKKIQKKNPKKKKKKIQKPNQNRNQKQLQKQQQKLKQKK